MVLVPVLLDIMENNVIVYVKMVNVIPHLVNAFHNTMVRPVRILVVASMESAMMGLMEMDLANVTQDTQEISVINASLKRNVFLHYVFV